MGSDRLYGVETIADVEAMATAQGLVCLFPRGDELTMDLDSPGAYVNSRIFAFMAEKGMLRTDRVLTTRSKSGNTHVWIKMDFVITSEDERAAFQAALGSDPMREVLGLWRNRRQGTQVVFAMFETPEEAVKVEKWRKRFEVAGGNIEGLFNG